MKKEMEARLTVNTINLSDELSNRTGTEEEPPSMTLEESLEPKVGLITDIAKNKI